ncbi:hypothetical protein ISN34_17290 [Xanthomonas translucens pv. translucens]|uniref:Transposase n=1 Tax=Xanthomonas translucens pv. translucens TaxID=134875 RepID=A0ABW9KVH0_XANCT|nr:hypothetical protein [Xanthomonas translucens]QSQ34186.1 hypothetical protein ISN31_00475 [Xanthomonas translucens pv. translucens]QSQ44921.1 hypothetical protein ISN34_17290 [Xanthomonas translucens pv. translucens]UII59596.1 hypothetical protein LZE81_14965 [Xanthomonas translucens]
MERYLLMIHRYIELNPLRAAMTTAAEDDQWSSARFSLGIAADPTLSPHPAYLALGADPACRATSYRQWLNQGVTDDELHAIRLHLQQERALGHPRFQAMAARTLNRRACVQPSGRRKKSVTAEQRSSNGYLT